MNRILILIISLVAFQYTHAQRTGELYLKYEKDMLLLNGDDEVNFTFSIVPNNDSIVNTYHFKVDNMGKNFELKKVEEIKDTINQKEFDTINLKTVRDLKKFSTCDLHIKFSELKNIYLVKTVDGVHYKYRLIYWSTQRGWQRVNTN